MRSSNKRHELTKTVSLRRGRAVDRALAEAVGDGDVEGVNDLISAGANVNATLEANGSALITAAREGKLDMVRLLIDRGADPTMPVSGHGSPLIAAAREGRADVVGYLLERGVDVNQAVDGEENALMQVSDAGQLEMVKLLISRGANVHARVWAHVEAGAEFTVDAKTGKVAMTHEWQAYDEWRTPLSLARQGGHKAVIDYLIGAGAQD